jgi:hypothetical protein
VQSHLCPTDPELLHLLIERNADIEFDEAFGYTIANLQLPAPELLSPGEPGLRQYDRIMQLMFMALVMAARGEITEIPHFGPGTQEEAANRGWIRSHTCGFLERETDEEQVAIFELCVTAEGRLGGTGLYFAFPEANWTAPVSALREHDLNGIPWSQIPPDPGTEMRCTGPPKGGGVAA